MTTISVRVPERLRDQLDALAKATDRNRQYHAFEALRRYVDAEAWQVVLIAVRLRQLDTGEIGYADPERVAVVRARGYCAERAGGGPSPLAIDRVPSFLGAVLVPQRGRVARQPPVTSKSSKRTLGGLKLQVT